MAQNGLCFWHGIAAGQSGHMDYLVPRKENGTPVTSTGDVDKERELQETVIAHSVMLPYMDWSTPHK